MNKIHFKDLSTPLKIAVISAWFVGGVYCTSLIVGFVLGIVEVL